MNDALQTAYEEIFLKEWKGEISRAERNARIVALRDSPLTAGLTYDQRDAIANKAVERIAEIMDEVHLGPSGRWQ